MNMNNKEDQVFNNNNPHQQYYNNGKDNSNLSIRRERYSNEIISEELPTDNSIRRRSIPQELYSQPKRLSSSTAAIRDENIVYCIDQKVSFIHEIICSLFYYSHILNLNCRSNQN